MRNVLVLGCGRVGSETAKALARNRCNVTVVDSDRNRLLELQASHDLRTVHGSAADPAILRHADGENADIVIAVTAIDEINLAACRLCALFFKTPTKIARLRAKALNDKRIAGDEGFSIDHIFCPEQIVADNICNTIRHPGCLSVHKFSTGQAALAVIRVASDGDMAGETVGDIRAAKPESDFRAVCVFRDNKMLRPDADTRLFVGDEVSLMLAEKDLDSLLPLLAGGGNFNRRVMLAGGGGVGERVAEEIEKSSHLKIIEKSQDRCRALTEKMSSALVLKGQASDERLLRGENIEDTDIYCALTNDDEENILSAMLAKRLGARKVMALVNRPAYADILTRLLDAVVSPSELSLGAIIAHIRMGDVGAVHSMRHGAAEAIEAVIHGDAQTSILVGRAVADIQWPAEAMLGAVVRGERVIVAHDRTTLQENDRLIIFAASRRAVKWVEKLLQVRSFYF
ncbi:MAG: Trk system potassium transporter TrkA [Gammaproteobacteria bacterium]